MITISELRPPYKLSGLSSFKVTFSYDSGIVEAIKTVPGVIWHAAAKFWECPASSLSELLDTLTMVSDIDLYLAPDAPVTSAISEPLTEQEVSSFKAQLFQHQVEAINYGLAKPKWLLTHGMGCGKTVSAMSLAEVLHKRGKISHCLIVCAVASLRQNWKKEIQKYSNETCMVLGEHITRNGTITYTTVKERVAQLMSPIDEFFIITNIESLRDDSVIKAISSGPNNIDMIVVDEIHRCLVGDTAIITSDGQLTLKQLAEYKKAELPTILTYNKQANKNEFQPILDLVVSNPTEELLELTIQEADQQYILKCTKSHKLYTLNRGWVKAEDLTSEDNIKIFS